MFRGLLTAVLLVLAVALSMQAPVLATDPSAAASPVATPIASPALVDPLDPRAGAGANRVGSPLLAMAFVIGLGAVVVAATVIFVRVARRP